MAEVYRARDLRLDRIVAVKTLRADLARDQTFQARFRREAQSAASLNNPTIVAVYDTGEDMSTGTPVPFIVMEYVDGRTVRDLLIEGHRLLPERTLEITSGVLKALEYSHQAGIVHRDIKPGNVMVTRNGDIKVMDFGIARAMNDAQATMTQTAQVIGTAQYLSPEQARGERVGPQSDLYSTGCLMYELLTGRPPFTGDSPVAIAYQHVRENPIPPSQLDPSLPRWADQIVLKAMAKSTTDRYQSAADMNADIQRAASGMQTVASLQPPTQLDEFYDSRTARMGQQTAMGAAATSVSPYSGGQATGYQTGYQLPDDNGYYGGGSGRRGGRRWAPWVVVGVVVAAIIVAVVVLKSAGGSSGVGVPLVQGESWTQAQSQLKTAGFNPVEHQEASTSVTKGDVISTSPSEGNTAPRGSTVQVNVSTGQAELSLPNEAGGGVNGNTAQTALEKEGFTNVSLAADPNSAAPVGTVVSQNPAPGMYTPDTPITLTTSGGGATVPNLVGLSPQEAAAALQQAGFTAPPTTNNNPDPNPADNAQPGLVYAQQPANGTVESKTDQVTIFVEPQNATSPTATPSGSTTPGGPVSTSPTATTPGATPTDTTTPAGGTGQGVGGAVGNILGG
jgi:serine/threonine-protein kinase